MKPERSLRLAVMVLALLLPMMAAAAEHAKPAPASEASPPMVLAYADRQSLFPGEMFVLHLAVEEGQTPVRGRVLVSRVGADHDTLADKVWQGPMVEVQPQPLPPLGAAMGMLWEHSKVPVETAPHWRSGVYLAHFQREDGAIQPAMAVVVVGNPRRDGQILLKLDTNTWQAYNGSGGGSFYAREGLPRRYLPIISFHRPDKAGLYWAWSHDYVLWLEHFAAQQGLTLDYATNHDIHQHPEQVDLYPLMINLGHDEYWSAEEYAAVERRIHTLGKNTLFLGANIGYHRVTYLDATDTGTTVPGAQLLCLPNLRTRPDPNNSLHKSRFRDEGQPESHLLGIAYDNSHFPRGAHRGEALQVAAATHRLFTGTGLNQGDKLPGLLGYEWDLIPAPWRWGRTTRPFLRPGTTLDVLFRGRATNKHNKNVYMHSVYYESQAGAKVFSAGTLQWSWGLGRPDVRHPGFMRFNANLIRDFLQPLTPPSHPALP
ncbi:MAG: hypothetical protein H7831_17485 [Magnetococcus sp. WYHC-3]